MTVSLWQKCSASERMQNGGKQTFCLLLVMEDEDGTNRYLVPLAGGAAGVSGRMGRAEISCKTNIWLAPSEAGDRIFPDDFAISPIAGEAGAKFLYK